jgi:SagB-type dehydrogenase family enzyme
VGGPYGGPETEAGRARSYHEATKHSWESVRRGDHVLDWPNKPFPFKIYPEAQAVALPRELAPPACPTLEALAAAAARPSAGRIDLPLLARLLFFTAGLTRKRVHPGGEVIHFRAAASTGALYEVEIYVVAGAVPGLAPGVYHFGPGDLTLRALRPGDRRADLAEATGRPEQVRAAPVTLILSAIYWRNTWKYRARAYRHFWWNAGTLLANLLATAAAEGVAARVCLGFADGAVDALLGLDSHREASLALAPLGIDAPAPPPVPSPEPLALATVPLSSRETDYPLVRQALAASRLPDGAAARAWVGEPAPPAALPSRLPASRPLGETILRRGSTRRFAHESIPGEALLAVLDAAVRDLPLDVDARPGRLVDVYLLVHAVDGFAPGAYVFDPTPRALRLLKPGEFRAEGGYLCLEQDLGADASAVVFFLADLEPVLARYGDRGYRAVSLAAGLLGGRMYLAAYSLGLGATGLTFYDDDVVRFFAPDATGKDAVFVTALGRSRRS